MDSFARSTEALAHVFAETAAPAFYLAAVISLLMILLGQYVAVAGRLGDAFKEAPENSEAQKAKIGRLAWCANCLINAVYCAIAASISIVALLGLIFCGAFYHFGEIYGAGVLFLFANALTVAALVLLVVQLRVVDKEIHPYHRNL